MQLHTYKCSRIAATTFSNPRTCDYRRKMLDAYICQGCPGPIPLGNAPWPNDCPAEPKERLCKDCGRPLPKQTWGGALAGTHRRCADCTKARAIKAKAARVNGRRAAASALPQRVNWAKVDWSRTDAALAEQHKVTRATVAKYRVEARG